MRPAQQQPPAPETSGRPDRRNPRDPWYLVWRATCALILAWLLVCGWLARPVPPWASSNLGAWSGKECILRPDSLLSTPQTTPGSDRAGFASDPALRFTLGSEASLGRLPLRLQTFTLAGWIRTPSPTNALPPGWLVVQQLEGDRSRITRLSRNLHDGTIQNLYAVGLHLQYAHRHLADAPPRALDGIEDSQRLLQESIVTFHPSMMPPSNPGSVA